VEFLLYPHFHALQAKILRKAFPFLSALLRAGKETKEEFFVLGRKIEPLGCLLYHVENRATILRLILLLVRDPLDRFSNVLALGHYTHGSSSVANDQWCQVSGLRKEKQKNLNLKTKT
jgi:hypothetical protein